MGTSNQLLWWYSNSSLDQFSSSASPGSQPLSCHARLLVTLAAHTQVVWFASYLPDSSLSRSGLQSMSAWILLGYQANIWDLPVLTLEQWMPGSNRHSLYPVFTDHKKREETSFLQIRLRIGKWEKFQNNQHCKFARNGENGRKGLGHYFHTLTIT